MKDMIRIVDYYGKVWYIFNHNVGIFFDATKKTDYAFIESGNEKIKVSKEELKKKIRYET